MNVNAPIRFAEFTPPAPPEPALPQRSRLLPHVAAVAVASIVFALIYDPFHAGALAFLAIAPITLVFCDPLLACSLRRAASCGFSFGLVAAMAITGPWIFSAATDYFGRGSAWSFGFTLALNAGYVALFYAPCFVMLRLLVGCTPVLRVLGAASVWTLFEALRSAEPAGNAWALLGHGFANVPLLREAAAYGGVPLLSWIAALGGAAIGVGLQPGIGPRDALRCTVLAVAAPLFALLLAGIARQTDGHVTPLQPLKVAVVQQEIPSQKVWDPASRIANWNAYFDATAALEPGKVDVVVWPESAAPFLLDADSAARERLSALAQKLGAAILLGAPRSEATDDGRALLHNSAWFFPANGAAPIPYDKRRLLPFVESAPLDGAGEELAAQEYSPGRFPVTFDVRGWQLAPLLCFEAIYPQYAREAVAMGAHLLVNLSNDAWFSGGAGPEQHAAMSMLRTVELRRPMLRATNGGVSGAWGIDGYEIGIPLRRQKALRSFEIPPPPRTTTFASKHPDFVAYASALLALLAFVSAILRRRSRR